MKIEILQGPSCSGKSTYAQDLVERFTDNLVTVISRDKIRETLLWPTKIQTYFDEGMDYCLEDYITTIEHKELAKAIVKQKDHIIIDNTNLKKKYIQEYIDIFGDLNVPFRDVSIRKFEASKLACKRRSNLRFGKITPPEVIDKQFEQMKSIDWTIDDFKSDEEWLMSREKRKWHYCQFQVDKYFPNVTKPDAIICDLDGTLCHRRIHKKGKLGMRSYFDYSQCDDDEIDLPVADVVSSMVESQKIRILFVSGRKESGRETTETFISGCFGKNFNYELFMREEDDNRSDAVTKYEIFNKFIRDKYYIKFVIDDRDRVCAMWEELGLKVFNVGSLNDSF